jgi:putative ABC transport system permease protein
VGDFGINPWIIGFGTAMAVLTTLLAALAPAIGGTRRDSPATTLRASAAASADRSTVAWRRVLIGAQAAITTALLISAVLLLASFWRLAHVPLGFDANQVLTVEMRLLDDRYRQPAAVAAFQDGVLERVRAVPGVIDAGLTSAVPFRGVDFTLGVARPGDAREKAVQGRYVDAGYFGVLGIARRSGRLFSRADTPGSAPVALLSESLARDLFGAEDPLGQMVRFDRPLQVVGIVADVRYQGLAQEPRAAIYLPRSQSPNALICLVAKVTGPADALAPAIHRAIRAVDPTVPAMKLTTVDRIVSESVADRRFYTAATTAFAAIALVLTIVGLSVVVVRVIAERRRELAIRAALGASFGHLVRTATSDGLAAVGIGIAVGLAGALAGSVPLERFLFQIPARAPAAYAAVAALLLLIAGIAGWLAARRLARLPVAAVLRSD